MNKYIYIKENMGEPDWASSYPAEGTDAVIGDTCKKKRRFKATLKAAKEMDRIDSVNTVAEMDYSRLLTIIREELNCLLKRNS